MDKYKSECVIRWEHEFVKVKLVKGRINISVKTWECLHDTLRILCEGLRMWLGNFEKSGCSWKWEFIRIWMSEGVNVQKNDECGRRLLWNRVWSSKTMISKIK